MERKEAGNINSIPNLYLTLLYCVNRHVLAQ